MVSAGRRTYRNQRRKLRHIGERHKIKREMSLSRNCQMKRTGVLHIVSRNKYPLRLSSLTCKL